MVRFLQACADGLLTGALYAVIGMGLALIFGVMRIVNFAHGAFLMVGMYATYVLFDYFKLNPYIGFLPAGIALFIFGYLIYMALIRPIRDRSHFMQILMTMGIGLILTDAAQLIFKADYRQTNIDLINRSVHLGPFGANAAEVLSFAIAVAFVIGLRHSWFEAGPVRPCAPSRRTLKSRRSWASILFASRASALLWGRLLQVSPADSAATAVSVSRRR